MGDYFDYQRFNNKTFITYADYGKGNFGGGDLIIADDIANEYFTLSVEDTDQNGYLSQSLFGVSDNGGQYKIDLEGYYMNDTISGTMTISLLYGDMQVPFSEKIYFEATR